MGALSGGACLFSGALRFVFLSQQKSRRFRRQLAKSFAFFQIQERSIVMGAHSRILACARLTTLRRSSAAKPTALSALISDSRCVIQAGAVQPEVGINGLGCHVLATKSRIRNGHSPGRLILFAPPRSTNSSASAIGMAVRKFPLMSYSLALFA